MVSGVATAVTRAITAKRSPIGKAAMRLSQVRPVAGWARAATYFGYWTACRVVCSASAAQASIQASGAAPRASPATIAYSFARSSMPSRYAPRAEVCSVSRASCPSTQSKKNAK